MEIIKGLYLNTDKIIIGKEYKVIYKKEIENDEIVDYDNKDLQKYFLQIDKEKYEFEKSEIGYIVKAVFRKEKNKVEVYSIINTERNNKENKKIHIEEELTAIIEPENLKNIYSQKKQNDLLVIKKSKNIFAFSEQVINAITKAFRSFPKSS
jgi:hypothetical protein